MARKRSYESGEIEEYYLTRESQTTVSGSNNEDKNQGGGGDM